jgi:hypothetical protein
MSCVLHLFPSPLPPLPPPPHLGRFVSVALAAAARLLPMLPASAAPDVTKPLALAIMRLERDLVTTEPVGVESESVRDWVSE